MAETAAARAIVPEVLNEHNYDDWKFRLQTYLMAQDLWDVIAKDEEFRAEDLEDKENKTEDLEDKEKKAMAWLKKKATALHVIHISCGRDAFRAIIGITCAKIAWNKLESKYNPSLVTESSNSQEAPITNTDENFEYQFLFDAVQRNDWTCAQQYLNEHPEALRSTHPVSGYTALHAAVYEGNEQIVKELVFRMQEEDLEIKDNNSETALSFAINSGLTCIAICIANKNRKLLAIPCRTKTLPVTAAFIGGNINLARYLYSIMPPQYLLAEEGCHGAELLVCSMRAEQYDLALDLLKNCPGLTIFKYIFEDSTVAFPTASQLNFWQQWIYDRINVPQQMVHATGNICVDVSYSEDSQTTRRNNTSSGLLKQFASNARKLLDLLSATLKTLLGIKHLHKMKLADTCLNKVLQRICDEIKNLDDKELQEDTSISNVIIQAIAKGVVEFVSRLTRANPRLFGIIDRKTGRNMIMIAIQHRQEKIVSLFMHKSEIVGEVSLNSMDIVENSPLHMTGLLPPSSHLDIIPGPALQMQKELQWFKEVESLIESKLIKSLPNDKGMTAREYFTKNHEELRKGGEKWMKDTATSYSFVAALIVTITFAAGLIVPGGGNDMRSLSRKKWYLVFMISDAVSLFSSTTSVIMFLGILTSHYFEEAFLESLPKKLILGMSALFLSIATMMICFCAALYEMLQGQLGILIPIILLAIIPIYLFISLQFPLLVDIFKSTYGTGLGIAPKKDK